MRPLALLPLLAALACSAASAAAPAPATPVPTNPPLTCTPAGCVPATVANHDVLHRWLTENGRRNEWKRCPGTPQGASVVPASPGNPAFVISGTLELPGPGIVSPGRCRQSGPRQWEGGQWWVQVISNLKVPSCKNKNLATCRADIIRVCKYPVPAMSGTGGPCKTADGLGPKGCEVCVAQEHQP